MNQTLTRVSEKRRILAIDPGNEFSAYTLYLDGVVLVADKVLNAELLLDIIPGLSYDVVAIEMVACYGMPVGATIFETCVWIGRFKQTCFERDTKTYFVFRRQVKMHLCHSAKAKDSNVRQAIIDLYPAIGGGSTPQIGTKKKPGPLYGISADMWASLGVAITFDETM